jgi:hypothetical protein
MSNTASREVALLSFSIASGLIVFAVTMRVMRIPRSRERYTKSAMSLLGRTVFDVKATCSEAVSIFGNCLVDPES